MGRTRAGSVCSQHGCPNLQPCGVPGHARESVRFHHRASPKPGPMPAWLHAAALERDGYRCQEREGEGICGRYTRTVDHILARALGGLDVLDNVRACCPRHNGAKAGREAHESRRRRAG